MLRFHSDLCRQFYDNSVVGVEKKVELAVASLLDRRRVLAQFYRHQPLVNSLIKHDAFGRCLPKMGMSTKIIGSWCGPQRWP